MSFVWKMAFGAAFFVAMLGFPAAQSQTPGEANRQQGAAMVEKAQAALARGNPQGAIRDLSAYLQTHGSDAAARVTLAQAYAMAGQSDRAETEFKNVLEISPGNYIALASLGEIYAGVGRLENAEPMLARAAKASGGNTQIRIEWALVLARLHRYQEARSALAGLAPPKDREQRIAFHRLKASVESGLANPRGAASEMEKALALKPDDPGLAMATAAAAVKAKNWRHAADLATPLFSRSRDPGAGLILLEAQLGLNDEFQSTLEALRSVVLPAAEETALRQRVAELLVEYGKFSESVTELKGAAELEPTQPSILFNLALAQFKAGLIDDASVTAEKYKAMNDSAEIEDLIGDIQEARGDNLAAVKSYQAAVALAPTEEKYRLSLAVELIRHKSFDAARVVLKQAQEQQPKSWRVQLSLAMVESFTGTDDEATRILMHAADLAPEPEMVLRYLGEIQLNQAAAPDRLAVTRLCEYAEKHPTAGKILFYCGSLIFRGSYTSGDKKRANEILEKLGRASRLLPEDASPHCQRGRVLRWVERWQDALKETEACARMDPGSVEGHYRLAQIYQHLGEQERSKEEMKLYEEASQRVVDENARRDDTIKTFLLTIQKVAPDHK